LDAACHPQEVAMPNILLVTQGTGGDLHPFIEIGVTLKVRGHTVTLITNQRFESDVKGYGLDFCPLESENLLGLRQESGYTIRRNTTSIDPVVFASCIDKLNKINERCQADKTALVSHFNLNLLNQTIAEKLGLSYVTVFTAPYFVMQMTVVEQTLNSESNLVINTGQD
jgi:rhamnosyltransferase subunit B